MKINHFVQTVDMRRAPCVHRHRPISMAAIVEMVNRGPHTTITAMPWYFPLTSGPGAVLDEILGGIAPSFVYQYGNTA